MSFYFLVNGLAGADGEKVRFVWDLILIYVTLKFIQVNLIKMLILKWSFSFAYT